MNRRLSRRFGRGVERLELRKLMAADVRLDNGVLRIQGTENDDRITFGRRGAGSSEYSRAIDRRRGGTGGRVHQERHAARGRALAEELHVPVAAALLPPDKVKALAAARAKFGPVAMIGDGINDAPALAASDLGIALGCGVDVSRESAAVCLVSNDLALVPWSLQLARRTRRIILQNLFWAFSYNVVGIGLAAAATPVTSRVMASNKR